MIDQVEIVTGPRNRKKRYVEEDEEQAFTNEFSSEELAPKQKKKKEMSKTSSYRPEYEYSTHSNSARKSKDASASKSLDQRLSQHISKLDPAVKQNSQLMKMLAKIAKK